MGGCGGARTLPPVDCRRVWFVEESFRQGKALMKIRLVLAVVLGSAATPAGQQRRILGYPEGNILMFGPRIAESLDRLIADLYR